MLGGLLAAQSYLYLLVSDAVTSLFTAGIVLLAISDTLPQADESETQSMVQSMKGYSVALRNVALLGFLVASMLMTLVYIQMNTTLAVFLRGVHGVAEQGYGYVMTLNMASFAAL